MISVTLLCSNYCTYVALEAAVLNDMQINHHTQHIILFQFMYSNKILISSLFLPEKHNNLREFKSPATSGADSRRWTHQMGMNRRKREAASRPRMAAPASCVQVKGSSHRTEKDGL